MYMLRRRRQRRWRRQLLPSLPLPLLLLRRPHRLPLRICCNPGLLAGRAICRLSFSPRNLPASLPLPLLTMRHVTGLCHLPAAARLLPLLPICHLLLFLLQHVTISLRCLPRHSSCSGIGYRRSIHLLPPARLLQADLCRLLQQQPQGCLLDALGLVPPDGCCLLLGLLPAPHGGSRRHTAANV